MAWHWQLILKLTTCEKKGALCLICLELLGQENNHATVFLWEEGGVCKAQYVYGFRFTFIFR